MASNLVPKAPMPVRAQQPLTRQSIEHSNFVPVPDQDRPTKEQQRIGREVVRRNAAIEAQAFTGAFANQATGALSDHASYVHHAASLSILGRNAAAPDFVRVYTDPFTEGLMNDMGSFMRTNAAYGAEQISAIVAQPYDLPERKRRWEKGER